MSKRLGQHFLVNKRKIRKIIDSLNLKDGDLVVEIGPGKGALTKILLEYPVKLVAIEKDGVLVEELVEKFKMPSISSSLLQTESSLRDCRGRSDANRSSLAMTEKKVIIEGDALEILPVLADNLQLFKRCRGLQDRGATYNYKLVGNIPYYITGRLLRVIGELRHKPKLTVLTVQKEVAERICAEPPKMNLLAASVQYWAEVKIVGYVPRKDFRPPPKVDSAIIRLESREQNLESRNAPENYYRLVRTLFKHPRKTILNNLQTESFKVSKFKSLNDRKLKGLKDQKEFILNSLEKINIDPGDRAQNLSIKEIIKLAGLLYTSRNGKEEGG